MQPLLPLLVLVAFLIITMIVAVSRFKRCPSDKIMVVYGKVSGDRAAKCVHGGLSFVWPIIQAVEFLDLKPITIEINLTNALSKQNIRINVPSYFTIGISTESSVMNNAAERLLGLNRQLIEKLAEDIIFGQLRGTIATMNLEEINADREKFEYAVVKNVESELNKIGLKLINVNITDITDDSSYIESLGRKAAAIVVHQAKIDVAEQERYGATGESKAIQEKRTAVAAAEAQAQLGENNARASVADSEAELKERQAKANATGEAGVARAEQEKRIAIAAANAKAVTGENESKAQIADSLAKLREREAEAQAIGDIAEATKRAEAERKAYEAQTLAEEQRKELRKAKLIADEIVLEEIKKEKVRIAAEAEKDKAVLEGRARGEAYAAEMAGQAEGMKEILEKQAEGLHALVKAAGNDPQMAIQFMLADQVKELTEINVQAIKNIDFGKVVVWDSGSSEGSSTANFLSGLMKSVPPMQELFQSVGLKMPEFLGQKVELDEKTAANKEKTKTPGATEREK